MEKCVPLSFRDGHRESRHAAGPCASRHLHVHARPVQRVDALLEWRDNRSGGVPERLYQHRQDRVVHVGVRLDADEP